MPVDLNARYNNAWFEVNTRLALRQNAISVYAILMSFVTAGMGLTGAGGAPIARWIAFLVPLLSLLFALLVFMHDRIMSNLCHFIRECEQLGNGGTTPLPNYLSDARWRQHDDRIRVCHHLVCAALIVVFNVFAFLAAQGAHPDLFSSNSALMWSQLVLALAATLIVLSTMKPSKKGEVA